MKENTIQFKTRALRATALGQVGYLFELAGMRLLIDPYLTDSVAETYGAHLRRLAWPQIGPADLAGIDWVLLTHAHLDHADPDSLRTVFGQSPGAHVLCPYEVTPIAIAAGARPAAVVVAEEIGWRDLGSDLSVKVIPAAHTAIERNEIGQPRYVGFLLKGHGTTLYHAGDTIPHPEIFSALKGERIDFGFLPVNERNFFRDEAGIVGNMTVREAFEMADRLGVATLVPTHWDLFAPNSTTLWEIEALHSHLKPSCRLRVLRCGEVQSLEAERRA